MPTKFFGGQMGSSQGNFGTTVVNSTASNRRFSFVVPSDVTRIVSLELNVVASQLGAVGPGKNLDFLLSYVKTPPGGAPLTISDTSSTYTINPVNQITRLDLTSFFGSGPGLDNSAALSVCGLRMFNFSGGRIEILGIVMQYTS